MGEETGVSGFVLDFDGDDIFALVQADGEFTPDWVFVIGALGDADAIEEYFGGIVGRESETGIPGERRGGEKPAEINDRCVGLAVPDPLRGLGIKWGGGKQGEEREYGKRPEKLRAREKRTITHEKIFMSVPKRQS